ncbi:hypothetical protein BLA29_015314 [Euroglyphus maynei]|uniref:Uncharacterized protein n=1 Tax=Euroglyphus maynei TaxID=6958 RepID=A0A1Y3BRB5_EURMA|nr:hypothetical protein BLA29_015314 [Euroglyphus maynei]
MWHRQNHAVDPCRCTAANSNNNYCKRIRFSRHSAMPKRSKMTIHLDS